MTNLFWGFCSMVLDLAVIGLTLLTVAIWAAWFSGVLV